MRIALIAALMVIMPFSGWLYKVHADQCSPTNWEKCR